MKKHIKNIGVYVVCVGVLLILAAFLAGWTDSNLVFYTALLFIIGGIAGHIFVTKRQSKY